jgi:hypothetical protein
VGAVFGAREPGIPLGVTGGGRCLTGGEWQLRVDPPPFDWVPRNGRFRRDPGTRPSQLELALLPQTAIVVWQVEQARERARAADAAFASGERWEPVHGIPMTVKESFNLAGLPSIHDDPSRSRRFDVTAAIGRDIKTLQKQLEAGVCIKALNPEDMLVSIL